MVVARSPVAGAVGAIKQETIKYSMLHYTVDILIEGHDNYTVEPLLYGHCCDKRLCLD